MGKGTEQATNAKDNSHVPTSNVTKLSLKFVQDMMLRSLTINEEEMVSSRFLVY